MSIKTVIKNKINKGKKQVTNDQLKKEGKK